MARRILVIDDEKPILFAIREYFCLRGYQVDCAGDPEGAEAFLADGAYAIAIVDLRLGGGADSTEGLELIKYIRERCPQTAILLLTAYGNPSIEQEALSRGATAFLHKPMPLPEIARIVAELLRTRDERSAASDHEPSRAFLLPRPARLGIGGERPLARSTDFPDCSPVGPKRCHMKSNVEGKQ